VESSRNTTKGRILNLYHQYVISKTGVDIYFIPIILNNTPIVLNNIRGNIYACLKYGKTDTPAFHTLEIDDDIEKSTLDSNLARHIIENLFNGKQTYNMVMGLRNGNK